MKNWFKKPEIYYGESGYPNIDISKFQFWLYRDHCIEELKYVLSQMPPEMAKRQEIIARSYFKF